MAALTEFWLKTCINIKYFEKPAVHQQIFRGTLLGKHHSTPLNKYGGTIERLLCYYLTRKELRLYINELRAGFRKS